MGLIQKFMGSTITFGGVEVPPVDLAADSAAMVAATARATRRKVEAEALRAVHAR